MNPNAKKPNRPISSQQIAVAAVVAAVTIGQGIEIKQQSKWQANKRWWGPWAKD